MTAPTWLLVCGVNGAGKSTFAQLLLKAPEMAGAVCVNPDVISADHRDRDASLSRAASDILALRDVSDRLRGLVERRESFVSETVIIGPAYRRHIGAARAGGFTLNAAFIGLRSVEQSISRVQLRVRSGGHSVPEAAIRRRWDVVHASLVWLATHADRLDIYSNATDEGAPALVGRVRGGRVGQLDADAVPAVAAALRPLAG